MNARPSLERAAWLLSDESSSKQSQGVVILEQYEELRAEARALKKENEAFRDGAKFVGRVGTAFLKEFFKP